MHEQIKRTPSIRYAVLDYGGVCGKTSAWIAKEVRYATTIGHSCLGLEITPDALTERSRSRLLGLFMHATNDDVLVMFDRDMVSDEVGAMVGLCKLAYANQCVVGGVYSKKTFGDGWAGASLTNEAMHIGDSTAPLVKANYVAGGAIAIPRVVIERNEKKLYEMYSQELKQPSDTERYNIGIARIREKWISGGTWTYYDWFKSFRRRDNASEDTVIIGEDHAFSERIKFCGEGLYLAQQFRFGHVGEFVFWPEHGAKHD